MKYTRVRVECSLKLSSNTADCSLVSLSFFLEQPYSSRSATLKFEGNFSTSNSSSSPANWSLSLLMKLDELKNEDTALAGEAWGWKLKYSSESVFVTWWLLFASSWGGLNLSDGWALLRGSASFFFWFCLCLCLCLCSWLFMQVSWDWSWRPRPSRRHGLEISKSMILWDRRCSEQRWIDAVCSYQSIFWIVYRKMSKEEWEVEDERMERDVEWSKENNL